MDAVVIGSGPNGLTAAATLARAGWRILVVEASHRPGGAVFSVESTLPGYLHDVGAAFFPFADDSPAFKELDLSRAGLRWANAEWESSHPAPDGSNVAISTDLQKTVASFGRDGPAWRKLGSWMQAMGSRLPEALLAPLPALRQAWALGIRNLIRFGWSGIVSTETLARRHFDTEAARRVIPALALHVDLGPRDWTGGGLGLVLALLASYAGFRIPLGGAKAITDALLARLEEAGGTVRFRAHVDRIRVSQGRAVSVVLSSGEEIDVRRAVLADVGAPALYQKLLDPRTIPGYVARQIRRFRYGWGTFKMDWALSGPVPWNAPEARTSAVVHTGDSIADLLTFTRQVRRGELPSNPYLVIGQQSLVDPSRAPQGGHTLWAYSRVPSELEGGWPNARESFADRIEERIEQLAPGFRSLIQERAICSPVDLFAMNENLVGGDLGGGSAQFDHQLFLRPAFPYFNYRTPVRGVYLASASSPPGAGVHGACGFNAARLALHDLG